MSNYDSSVEKHSIAYKISNILQDGLIHWQGALSRENYDKFSLSLVDFICVRMENIIFNCKFNQLGALILDKEIKMIGHVFLENFDSQSSRALNKLAIYAEVLMLDTKLEFEQYCSMGGVEVSQEQISKLAKLRVDF